ncbi:hypothetical protein HPB50_021984 [Hyalomma asiaticum]|uniref:Uncharacterized protein n=1 Tax=Hyalomma asiaticum TaxID=266040 RepID=A0ACB7S8J1_HYAAI|nr:hypothetical protein HPB50_021984 [Hyalomma asiaticum]
MAEEARRYGYAVLGPDRTRSTTVTLDRKTGVACKRVQFPLVEASAITVHKSQGCTYSSVVYGYDKTYPQKLVYVAFSRCANINSLYLTNAKGDHCFYHRRKNEDTTMLSEFRRLEQHELSTVTGRFLRALREEGTSSHRESMRRTGPSALNASEQGAGPKAAFPRDGAPAGRPSQGNRRTRPRRQKLEPINEVCEQEAGGGSDGGAQSETVGS